MRRLGIALCLIPIFLCAAAPFMAYGGAVALRELITNFFDAIGET